MRVPQSIVDLNGHLEVGSVSRQRKLIEEGRFGDGTDAASHISPSREERASSTAPSPGPFSAVPSSGPARLESVLGIPNDGLDTRPTASAPTPLAGLLTAHQSADYVIVFERSATSADLDAFCNTLAAASSGSGCPQKYYTVFLGCAATLTPKELQTAQLNPKIASVTFDGNVSTSATMQEQSPAPWNLDRIDQPGLPLDNVYHYALDGTGVRVYVLDTGVRKTHQDFQYSNASQAQGVSGSRVVDGYSVYGDDNSDDCFGHGTHVSGIVGGLQFGVAKNVTIIPVRCIACDGAGKASEVIAGVDWVAANLQLPAVVSMSLGADTTDAVLDAAVQAVIDLGAPVITAAGNFNNDACQLSPGRVPSVVNVAASDQNDARWPNSNYGKCVTLYAPGVAIRSDMYYTDTANIVASGTSMACPHVSGVAALYLQANPSAQSEEVAAYLQRNTVNGIIQNALTSSGTPNRLLQTDLAQQATVTIAPDTLPPVVLYEGSFGTTATQTLTLSNADTNSSSSVDFALNITSTGLLGGWITADPSNGTLTAGQKQTITLKYDIGDNEFQGVYEADVLITTTGQPLAKVLKAVAYIFCSQLQSQLPSNPHRVSVNFTLAQDTQPTANNWTSKPATSPAVYVNAAVQFSHPVTTLNTSFLTVNNGAGKIEGVNVGSSNGQLCSVFQVRASVPFSPWHTEKTTVCLTIAGSQVLDVNGENFPAKQACVTLDHRPVGILYAPYSAFGGGLGAVTGEQNVALLAVFSEAITGLTTSSFKISGPDSASITALKLLPGTSSYYQLVAQLPASFYGQATVSFVGTVKDAAGSSNTPISPLQFSRVKDPLLFGTSYRIVKPPVLTLLN